MPRLIPTSLSCLVAASALCLATTTHAGEGMWTFDNPPLAQIQKTYGLQLTPQWLQALQLAAVNFGGASGSFVSSQGLVLTNHHVARGCITRLSTPQQDLDTHGFQAASREQELRCPGTVLKTLISSEDVTAQVQAATAGAKTDLERTALRKQVLGQLESQCEKSTGLRCQMVGLYGGAQTHLYRYQEWDDVRLVFAPEQQAANFGGDDDNFTFPRYAFDFTLVRVYRDGKPITPPGVLKLAEQPLKAGDPVFVAGHPGSTDRLLPVAQLLFERDVSLPQRLAAAKANQALLHAYAKRSPEAARQAAGGIAGVENWLKAMTGEYKTLLQPEVMAAKLAAEQDLRKAWVQRGGQGVDPWLQAEQAVARLRAREAEVSEVGFGRGLLGTAGALVQLAQERQLPEAERLPGFREAALPQIERRLKAPFPVYPELSTAQLQLQLERAQQRLGAEHPFVKALLQGATPALAAQRLVSGTTLADPAVRAQLMAGGLPALQASTDPMVQAALAVAPLVREIDRFEEVQVGAPLQKAAEQIARIRFEVLGTSVYPDATGTLRLSWGEVAGYQSEDKTNPWKTTFGGLYARADAFDGAEPFDLAPKVAAARAKIDPRWPLNLVTTDDIIGGNSGSPLVNARGELVGLIFDGNIESLAGRYVYRGAQDRAVSVDAHAVVRALETIYDAKGLAAELKGG
jgi:hypothetical protein